MAEPKGRKTTGKVARSAKTGKTVAPARDTARGVEATKAVQAAAIMSYAATIDQLPRAGDDDKWEFYVDKSGERRWRRQVASNVVLTTSTPPTPFGARFRPLLQFGATDVEDPDDEVVTVGKPPVAIDRIGIASLPTTLAITWSDKSTDRVDLTGVVARTPPMAALTDPAVFGQAELVAHGHAVAWPGDIDLGAGVLRLIADEQRPMTGDQAAAMRETLKLSQAELAEALGLSKRTVQNHEAAAEVPAVFRIALRAMTREPLILDALYRPRKAGRPPKTARE